jgi:ubiquitin-protein ligase
MLRTTNVDEIEQIYCIPKLLGRRIKRECQEIKDKYDDIFVEYNEDSEIIVGLTSSRNLYKFYIDKNYPFTAPRVTINGLSQNSFFRVPSNRFTTILYYITGSECFCCNSLLCKNNWSPALTLDKVIIQLEEYKKIKLNIQLKIIADKLKEKYLNRDIELDTWLFKVSVPKWFIPGKQYH